LWKIRWKKEGHPCDLQNRSDFFFFFAICKHFTSIWFSFQHLCKELWNLKLKGQCEKLQVVCQNRSSSYFVAKLPLL
jgi:hypothetical protein